jgi:hypothetical protein
VAVYARQDRGGELDEPLNVSANHPGVDDGALLVIKAESHQRNGWVVRWHGTTRFTATKRRWGDRIKVTRTFWSES